MCLRVAGRGAWSVHSFHLKAGLTANGHHSQCEAVWQQSLQRCAPALKHKDVRWNKEIQEWYCAKCGRTSDHAQKEDALVELEQYECELPTQI
jgi:hypothetical protein